MTDQHLFSASRQPQQRGSGPKPGQGAPRMSVKCPHCRELLQLRTSKQLTPLFKELRFQCVNIDCSGSYVASLTIDRAIRASASPNPSIKLPLAPPRNLEPANDYQSAEDASKA